jgi:hypothetical protein
MAPSNFSSSAHSQSVAWDSLVLRSIEASELLVRDVQRVNRSFEVLKSYSCLDDFLRKAPEFLMFWFFQQRDAFLSQETMTKWSPNILDNYVLLPATSGFVSRNECFFVSHFWRTHDHPDPDGQYLRLLQAELQPQHWSYIWVDWTCIPQSPRSKAEEAYFLRSLETMSGIIRNCGFVWFYPPFEARLWILYEVAEFVLTSSGSILATPDIRKFKDHVQEMVQTSVRSVLDKYSYNCTYDGDKAFLTSWLELLVLLRRLVIDVLDIRRLMDHITWSRTTKEILVITANGNLQLSKFQGTLIRNGECYMFTPFPEWVSLSIIILAIC